MEGVRFWSFEKHNGYHLVPIVMPELIYYEHNNAHQSCNVLLQHFDIIVIKLAVKQRIVCNSTLSKYEWPLNKENEDKSPMFGQLTLRHYFNNNRKCVVMMK